MPESNEKGRVSFEEVAKLALTPEATEGPAEERTENSGLINLTAMVAAEPISETKAASETKIQENSVTPVSSPKGGTPERKQSDRRMWIALATGIALGVLAAGVFFALRSPGSAHEIRVVAMSPASASATWPPVPAPKPNAPAAYAASDSHAAGPPSAFAQKIDPPAPDLAAGGRASSMPPRDALPTTNGPQPTGIALAKTAPPGAAASSPSQTPSVTGTDNSLEALIKHAVGPSTLPTPPRSVTVTEPTPVPAGNVPVKPALGAVQGAVGTVLPGARSCLGPDDPVSRATITFKSDGSVQGVAVSGHASGEPAEECIRSRLMAARIPPFASPTFTWTVTVRPAG